MNKKRACPQALFLLAKQKLLLNQRIKFWLIESLCPQKGILTTAVNLQPERNLGNGRIFPHRPFL